MQGSGIQERSIGAGARSQKLGACQADAGEADPPAGASGAETAQLCRPVGPIRRAAELRCAGVVAGNCGGRAGPGLCGGEQDAAGHRRVLGGVCDDAARGREGVPGAVQPAAVPGVQAGGGGAAVGAGGGGRDQAARDLHRLAPEPLPRHGARAGRLPRDDARGRARAGAPARDGVRARSEHRGHHARRARQGRGAPRPQAQQLPAHRLRPARHQARRLRPRAHAERRDAGGRGRGRRRHADVPSAGGSRGGRRRGQG
eukprot:2357817-Rhodomonas_salina.1